MIPAEPCTADADATLAVLNAVDALAEKVTDAILQARPDDRDTVLLWCREELFFAAQDCAQAWLLGGDPLALAAVRGALAVQNGDVE